MLNALLAHPKCGASWEWLMICEVLELYTLYVVCHGSGEPWPLAKGIIALPAMCLISPDWAP